MSRVAFVLAAISLAVMIVPASAGETAASAAGFPIAPNGGNASIHQWGGIDGIDLLRNERQSLERNQYVLLISAIHRDARDSLVRTCDKDSATA